MSRQNDARATAYRLLATAFLYPTDLDWELFSNSFQSLMQEAAADLGLDVAAELGDLSESWVHRPDDAFLHAYTELFLGSPRGIPAPLNESVYFGDQQLVNTKRTQQVAEAYQVAGFSPAGEYRDLLPDHLSLELEFMALGCLAGWDNRDFFLAHVHSWHPLAAARIIQADISAFYAAMARLLVEFLDWEHRLVADAGGTTQPSRIVS